MHGIQYALLESAQRHLQSLWGGDLYNRAGTLIQSGYCPDTLEELFTFTDKLGETRLFGPARVLLGRLQDDPTNLANKLSVPSVYIEISSNDYEETEGWRDSIYSSFDGGKALTSQDDERRVVGVGGMKMQFRRLVVKMTTFFIESDQDVAEVERLTSAAQSFLESVFTTNVDYPWSWAMQDAEGKGLVDIFGERPWRCETVISHSRRRGGPADDFITDIKLYIEVACFKEER